MQNTIRMIVQLIQATAERNSALYETAAKIEKLAGDLKDKDLAVTAIGNLAEEIDSPGAKGLCYAMTGLIAASNNVKLPGLDPSAIEAIGDLLEEKVQEVGSNGDSHTKRFYTEDCSERRWDAKHHLIDLRNVNGKNYMELKIHQFSQHSEDCCTVELACNEVEELLSIALTARLAEAAEQAKRYTPMEQAKGDDFDPFLDDLP